MVLGIEEKPWIPARGAVAISMPWLLESLAFSGYLARGSEHISDVIETARKQRLAV
jgi:hypothetical protein